MVCVEHIVSIETEPVKIARTCTLAGSIAPLQTFQSKSKVVRESGRPKWKFQSLLTTHNGLSLF